LCFFSPVIFLSTIMALKQTVRIDVQLNYERPMPTRLNKLLIFDETTTLSMLTYLLPGPPTSCSKTAVNKRRTL
jgi:hypothetical protein